MCVIIYVPQNERITPEELADAWTTNPDGAGIAYVKNDRVNFQRGFMNLAHYLETVQEVQAENNGGVLLHLRISTGAGVTPQGTHPYKVGNVLKMKGSTRAPVVCMNGIIYGQEMYSKGGQNLNDTASYIKDHRQALEVVNQDILNLIEENTGAKWAAATPGGVILSKGFTKYNGLYYSNTNHLSRYASSGADWFRSYSDDYYIEEFTDSLTLKDFLTSNKLYRKVQKQYYLSADLEDYVYFNCKQFECDGCKGCISNADTVKDLQRFLKRNKNRMYGGY